MNRLCYFGEIQTQLRKGAAAVIRLTLLLLVLAASTAWPQGKPLGVDVSAPTTPISIKLETAPPSIWQTAVQYALPAFVGAAGALLGAWLNSANTRRISDRQTQRDKIRWRLDKQMEVLSVLAPLFTQVRHAIDKLDSRLEKATVEGPTWTLTGTDQNAANAELLNLHQQLSAKREELAANVCSAGFVLAEPLWRQLQELEASFSDVCDRPVTNRRVEQLSNLKAATESFINASRNEVLSANN